LISWALILGAKIEGFADPSDALAFAVPVGVLVFVVWLFSRYFGHLKKRSKELLDEINEATRFLGGFAQDDARTRYGEIDQFFRGKDGVLKHYWREFSQSCVHTNPTGQRVEVYNTIDAAHFFPVDEIVDSELRTEVTRHAPGIFTASGIVGTFLGISLGLIKAVIILGGKESGEVTQATEALLWHVGPAFLASFVAVLLAVWFQYYERHRVLEVRQGLLSFQRLLDGLFPRKTAEKILLDVRTESEKQSLVLQKLSTDFASEMKPVLEQLVANQAQKMDETNQKMIGSLVQAIHSTLQPLAESLGTATRELKAEQSQNATGAIQNLVNQFSETLTSGAENQVSQLSKTLQSLASSLETQRSQMEEYLGRVGRTSVQQATLLEGQVETLTRRTQEQQEQTLDRIEALFDRLSASLIDQATRSSQTSNQALSSAGENLSRMVEQATQAQEVATSTLGSLVGQLQETMTRQMTAVAEQMTRASLDSSASVVQTQDRAAERIAHIMQATQESIEDNLQRLSVTLHGTSARHQEESQLLLTTTLNHLNVTMTELTRGLRTELLQGTSETMDSLRKATLESQGALQSSTESGLERVTGAVEVTLEKLTTRMEDLLAGSRSVNQALLERFDQQATLLERLTRQTHQQVGAVTEDLEGAAARVAGLVEHLGKLADGIRGSIQAQREVSGQLTEVARNLSGAAQAVHSQSNLAQNITNALALLGQKLETQNASADERIRTLRQLHQELGGLAQGLTEGVARQRAVIDDMVSGFAKMETSAKSYFNAVVPSLQKALGEFDTQLTRGTEMLGSAVADLAEPCEDIAGILQDLQKRLSRV
jgi:putative membrane protein